MTDLRTAATQALKTLDALWQHGVWGDFRGVADNLRAAMAEPATLDEVMEGQRALAQAYENGWNAAKAEPVQEPVAWMHTDPDNPRVKFLVWRENEPAYRGVWIKTPLYTSPPQRKPLTEDEIQELSQQHKFDSRMEKFVRIIERAHGIK
jgi:hypothetical protein